MYLEGVAILPQLHMFQKNRVEMKANCELDGRDRVVYVALRVQPLRVQAARVLLLDEQLEGAERDVRVHQQPFRGTGDHSVADIAACAHGELCVLLSAIVGEGVEVEV